MLLRISWVVDEPVKEDDPQVTARFAQLYGTAQYEAMLESLRSRADIEINPANLGEEVAPGIPATTWLNPAST